MSPGAPDPALPLVSSSANTSPIDGATRKSHDKTIGGVFRYTDGPDVESGYSDHRLDQLKNFRNGSHHSLTNGLPNGNVKASRDRSQSKASSIHSIGSAVGKQPDSLFRSQPSVDGPSRLSGGDNGWNEKASGAPVQPGGQTPELGKLETNLPPAKPEYDPYHMVTASTVPDTARSDGQALYLQPPRASGPTPARFSSPPAMQPSTSLQDPSTDQSLPSEFPKLTHRHTLQVPKSNMPIGRTSRDFSFAAGPSEEALSTTGRFSPTRDHYDSTLRHRRASLGLVRRTTRSMQSDAHLDEVPPDEDAARWTELIKQKRASKRKKREEEDDDRVMVGKKVEEGHVNWVTAYNMLTGIRFTVSRTNAKMDRELTDADFDAKHKFSFDITGNELTPSAKYDFKFKDYAPWVFRHLRAIFGLDPADYLVSLTSKYILSELGSPGKSGSFFYFSRDYKYIIKTIHHAEHKLLRRILRDYYRHVLDNPNTLISQFYGLHRVKIPYGRKIHFVVMNNLFPPHRDIHQMFDLKGSTIGRDFREEDLAHNPRATLKDLNWLRRDMHLEFDARVRRIFLEQLKRDVSLLQRLQIMDYSLLVGIHDLAKGNEENLREATLQVFQPGGEEDDQAPSMLIRTPSRLESARKARELRMTLKKEKPVPMGMVQTKMPSEMSSGDERQFRIFYNYDGGIRATHEDGQGGDSVYYLGVIDCLTHYGIIKRIEHFWKGLSAPRTQISPIPPQAYGERFLNFVTGITMTQEEVERRKTQDGRPSETQTQNFSVDIQRQPPREIHGGEGEGFVQSPTMSPMAVETTMRKAQKQTDKSTPDDKGRSGSEEEKPERILRTTEESRGPTLLPVVSEAGENGDNNEKRGLSAQDERGEGPLSASSEPIPPLIPGLRKVSPSTVATATDTVDDTSISSPDVVDFANSSPPEECEKEAVKVLREKPPRIASDLIQPQSPFGEGLLHSMQESIKQKNQ
ncbi:hypothetical protein PV08_00616 [Exophiala spinifera]|uniref:1-phosphatidylinositol-4-phosphate 5-kinase n=1 Tax=Exophiala spinifera TaxID=91928 RepID=A0A0D1YXQ4_9EURO|nr:uncharacterized protein PV08_00616 [Exophiala spinifera]KIW20041.1 hypothetical protein PV08_00616 [Exophiala spinifera]